MLFTILIILAIGFVLYYRQSHTYWKKRRVPTIPSRFPFGAIENPFSNKNYVGVVVQSIHNRIKRLGNGKYAGMYVVTIPKFLITDPALIKCILQQDYSYFTERGFYHNEKDDPLSANLFAVGGETWRSLRTKLSPVFTTGKLKMMFDTLLQCGCYLGDALDDIYKSKLEIDIKDVSVCFSMDVIGSCAFGVDCNSFKDPNSEFRQQGKKIFNFDSTWRRCKIVFAFVFPSLARFFKVTLFDKQSIKFFVTLVRETIKFRQKNNVTRNDMIQLLMESKKEDHYHGTDLCNDENTLREFAAQVFIFFAAGFETSSTTLSFCLYELAKNPEIQQRLREEICDILERHEGKITYESIMDMKYMNQVIDETLRKYPPVSYLTRVCVKDYKIPDTDIVLEKGVEVGVSLLGLHNDEEYYPEPQKFDPERFSEENKKQRLPFTYLPFGEGPRICIGLRFGLMEIKVALTILLQRYRFRLNEKMKGPIEFEPYSFTLIPKGKILLDLEKVII